MEIVRELENKLETLEGRAYENARMTLEKIENRTRVNTWVLENNEGTYGTEIVITKEGHVDFYLCIMERYSSKISYIRVANFQQEFSCGDIFLPNGEYKEYQKLGNIINTLNKMYSDLGFYFDNKNNRKILECARKQYEINKFINEQETETEEIEISLDEKYAKQLEESPNHIITTKIFKEIFANDDVYVGAYDVLADRFNPYYNLGKIMHKKFKELLDATINGELGLGDMDILCTELFRTCGYEQFAKYDTEIKILDFKSRKKYPTYEWFMKENCWDGTRTIVDMEKIYVFENAGLKVELFEDIEEVLIWDVTEQLEGQVGLDEIEIKEEEVVEVENKKGNLNKKEQEQMKKSIDDINDTIEEFGWTVMNILVNIKEENCIGAVIENQYGKLKLEGLYAGAHKGNESMELAKKLAEYYEVEIIDANGMDIHDLEEEKILEQLSELASPEMIIAIADKLGLPSLDEEVSPEPTAEDVSEWQGLEKIEKDELDILIEEFDETIEQIEQLEINQAVGIEVDKKLLEKLNRQLFKTQCAIEKTGKVYIVKHTLRVLDTPDSVAVFRDIEQAKQFMKSNENTLEILGLFTNEHGKLIPVDEDGEKLIPEIKEIAKRLDGIAKDVEIYDGYYDYTLKNGCTLRLFTDETNPICIALEIFDSSGMFYMRKVGDENIHKYIDKVEKAQDVLVYEKYGLDDYINCETGNVVIDVKDMKNKGNIFGTPLEEVIDKLLKENKEFEMKLFNENYIKEPHYMIFRKGEIKNE